MSDPRYLATYLAVGIGKAYTKLSLSDFKNDKTGKIVTLVQKYIDQFPKMQEEGMGFLFTGIAGCGKTMLASIILMEVMVKYRKFGYFLDMEQVLSLINNQWKSEEQRKEMERKIYQSPILVLDNVPFSLTKGKDPREVIFAILQRRVKANQVTILTTKNEKDLGEEVISLLKEATFSVALPFMDFRQNTNKIKFMKEFLT